jgi:ubiquitin carboxyl-terminal hydrolase 14
MEKEHDKVLYRPHGQGLDTGNYELVAVVTHKGRSADGGHYMGWVHHEGD